MTNHAKIVSKDLPCVEYIIQLKVLYFDTLPQVLILNGLWQYGGTSWSGCGIEKYPEVSDCVPTILVNLNQLKLEVCSLHLPLGLAVS